MILYLCEPDTRYYLGRGWYPWDEENTIHPVELDESIAFSISRYSRIIDFLKKKYELIVINVTPSIRIDQNQIVDKFNDRLKVLCEKHNIRFLDLNNKIYSPDGKIKEEYYADHVHLSTSLQILVENRLIEEDILSKPLYNSDNSLSNKDIQSKFKYDKRFGCYVLK